jgi:phosphohistidine phosphatase
MSTSKAPSDKPAPRRQPAAPKQPVEKFVVLLRHGLAEDPTPGKRDEDRSLTPGGHAKMKEISRGLAAALPKAAAIYSSPLLRCVQTALWVSKAYKSKANVTTADALAPGGTPKQFLELLAGTEATRIVIVGHEPSLTRCYGVRLGADGKATFEWLLPPRILRKLAE